MFNFETGSGGPKRASPNAVRDSRAVGNTFRTLILSATITVSNPPSTFLNALLGGAVGDDVDEHEYKRRFLSGLLLSLVPLAGLVGVLVLPRWLAPDAPFETATFQAASAFTVVLVVAFILNRVFGRYRVAASITVFSVLAAAFWASFDHAAMVQFVLIAVLVASALFTPQMAIFVGGAGALAAPLLALHPHHTISDVIFPTSFLATLTVLLFVVRHHHIALERRRRAEVQRSERWFSTTLRSIGDGVLTVDTGGVVTFMNPVAAELTGWTADEAKGMLVDEVFDIVNEHTGEPVENPVRKVLREGRVVGLANHTLLVSRGGRSCPIADSGAPIVEPGGRLHGVVLVFRDMTTEMMLTDRLRRAERLESLGQLAGGVAHDFNNLLTVIGSAAQFVASETADDSPVRGDLVSLIKATECAVSLTRQLLAFSRRQVMRPRVIRIDAAIWEAQRLLTRLLRDNVRIQCELDPEPGRVLIDPSQFEQVLVNLAINANDAMSDGGVLTIAAERVHVDTSEDVRPGWYVRVRVQDTGCGIEAAAMSRIFEPFFTTKRSGQGTGLGLATVHGIVRQSGGDISVESQLGVGTTFTVLLPSTELAEEVVSERTSEGPLVRTRTGKTVYLVEDDTMVRTLTVQILERLGYQVRAFSNGYEALRCYDTDTTGLDLLMTDVVMPGLSGPQVAEALRRKLPHLPVIFVSGYASETLAREVAGSTNSTFLEKPFTPHTLAETIRARLGS